MTRQARLLAGGGVALAVILALAWSSIGRDRSRGPGSSLESRRAHPSNSLPSNGPGDLGGSPTGQPVPGDGAADPGAARAATATRGGATDAPFNPLSLPDWFDARSHFSHARLQAVRGDSAEPLGVRVISVHPGLRLARLDVRPGDLLLRINGVSLTDPAHFRRVEDIVGWTFLRADLVIVKIRRAGEEFSLAEIGPIDTTPAETP